MLDTADFYPASTCMPSAVISGNMNARTGRSRAEDWASSVHTPVILRLTALRPYPLGGAVLNRGHRPRSDPCALAGTGLRGDSGRWFGRLKHQRAHLARPGGRGVIALCVMLCVQASELGVMSELMPSARVGLPESPVAKLWSLHGMGHLAARTCPVRGDASADGAPSLNLRGVSDQACPGACLMYEQWAAPAVPRASLCRS